MSGRINYDTAELSAVRSGPLNAVAKDKDYIVEADSRVPENIAESNFEIFKTGEDDISSIAITRDGNSIFVSDQEGNVFLYRYKNGALTKQLILTGNLPVLAISLSPNETMLAIAQFSSAVIYDLTQQRIVARQTRIKGRVKTLEWDPLGELVAVGLVSGGVYVWRIDEEFDVSEKSLEIYDGESVTPIVGIAFLPSAEAMFTASRQGEIKLWRLVRADEKLGFYDPNAAIDKDLKASYYKDVAVLGSEIETIWLNKQRLYAACADGMIYSWKVRGLKLLGNFKGDVRGVLSASPLLKSKIFATSGREQNLKMWCPDQIQSQTASFGEPLKLIAPDGQELTVSLPDLNLVKPKFQSGIFKSTLNLLKIASQEPVLWAYEKTGNLLRFDLRKLNFKGVCN